MAGAPHSYVALLRGINVGTAKRVAMSELRATVAGLGFENVRTVLNSGNVAFSTPRPIAANIGGRIEKALEKRTGVYARVTMLSGDELAGVVDANPLARVATNPSRYMIAVLASPADRKRLTPMLARDWGAERFALGDRVAYFWCPNGVTKSLVAAELGRLLRDGVTTRNFATMIRLRSMLDS